MMGVLVCGTSHELLIFSLWWIGFCRSDVGFLKSFTVGVTGSHWVVQMFIVSYWSSIFHLLQGFL